MLEAAARGLPTRRSRYTVSIGEGSAEVAGETKIRGHYFEDGNIQLQTSKALQGKTVAFEVSRALVETKDCYCPIYVPFSLHCSRRSSISYRGHHRFRQFAKFCVRSARALSTTASLMTVNRMCPLAAHVAAQIA